MATIEPIHQPSVPRCSTCISGSPANCVAAHMPNASAPLKKFTWSSSNSPPRNSVWHWVSKKLKFRRTFDLDMPQVSARSLAQAPEPVCVLMPTNCFPCLVKPHGQEHLH